MCLARHTSSACQTSHGKPQDPPTAEHADRRRFLVGLLGTTGTMLVGCTGDQLSALGSLNLVPESEVQQASAATWSRIRSETPASRDQGLQQMIRRVGTRIVNVSGFYGPNWEFVLFEEPTANAFALPNGKVGFYTGILRTMDSEDQVAAVMGHEVAHVMGRHGAQRMNAQQATALGLGLLQEFLVAGNIAAANQIAGILGAGAQYGIVLPYSRYHELEADRVGTELMARAAYDPRAALAYWQAAAQRGPGGFEFLSTHPSDQTRVAELTGLMPYVLPIYERAR